MHLFRIKNRGVNAQLTHYTPLATIVSTRENLRLLMGYTSVFLPIFFTATSDSRSFFMGGLKSVGSRFQVETQKVKWPTRSDISQNAPFSHKKQRVNAQLTHYTPFATIVARREKPSAFNGLYLCFSTFFFTATSDSRAFFMGWLKSVGSRFQVETQKTKWPRRSDISQNATFSHKKQRCERAIIPLHAIGNNCCQKRKTFGF